MAGAVPIDDPGDERIADFAGLRDAQLRRSGADGIFVVEGPQVVRRLLTSPYQARSILVTDRGMRALGGDIDAVEVPVYVTTQAVMEAVCGFHFHRGALASAERSPLPPLADVASAADLLVVVEGVNDNENLGSIFRNAAAFGVGGVVLDPTSADPLYRRTVRVSMGHVLHVPFTRAPAWPAALTELRDLGCELLALTPSAEAEDVRDMRPRRRQAVLLGAEGSGLSAAALGAADRRVRIGMVPGVDSLNVATAAAIVLHHLARYAS